MTRPLETVDSRMIALIRVILALVAFVFTFIDPTGPAGPVPVVYGALTLYIVYSAALYLATLRGADIVPARLAHWVDIAWYVLFVALGGGPNSVYFLFFFFAILVASFRSGLNAGLRAAAFSAALFTVAGYSSIAVYDYEFSRFVLRPVYLLVLGYMIAYWGGKELKLRRQLELLKDVTTTLNPRFGTHHLIGQVVRMLREFYDARACLLVLAEGGGGGSCLVFRSEAATNSGAASVERVPAGAVRALLGRDGGRVLVRQGVRGRLFGRAGGAAYDGATQEPVAAPPGDFESLAAALGARSLVSVPVAYEHGLAGRFHLLDPARPPGKADADFVAQVFEHTRPFIENVRLVDTLASGAARDERQKIARDIHDGVIQPYIGLQLGLEALRRQADGDPAMASSVERLLALTESGIEDLRDYVGGLREGAARKGSLLPALRRFGARFSEATGIAVTVESDAPDLILSDQLAGEVFLMAAEALSNVRRHTAAERAVVRVGCDGRELRLSVTNAGEPGDNGGSFRPRTISERASSLGGTASVLRPPQGGAVVEVKIPL